MKIDLKEYILEKRQVLLAVALGLLIYSLVLLLYQIPPEAAGYGILLVFIAEFVWLLSGFGRFRKKQKLLRQLAGERAKDFYLRDLPESEEPKEEAYQDLIESLLKEKNRKEAEAAEKLRDMEEYYTLWVHQIKTPIAAMSLLLQEEDTPENGELSMELFRIEQYVEMVLQYLRLDSPDHDLAFRSVDVDDCVRQAVRKYARSFIRKKIALDFQETGIETVSDEKWLVFVLEQLLSNALKYTKKGTIRIYGGNGFLYIEDTGIGIAPEDLPRIFEKGFTGYNGRSDKKSSGIGLYLCRRIAENLGCEISAASAVGIGTTVSLRFGSEACKNVRYE